MAVLAVQTKIDILGNEYVVQQPSCVLSKRVCQACYAAVGWDWDERDEDNWTDGYVRCRLLDETDEMTGDIETTLVYVDTDPPKKCVMQLEHLMDNRPVE